MVVYDNRAKVSAAGKILEVLGTNTYLVECGKGPQHISGDVISKVPVTADRRIGGENIGQQENGETADGGPEVQEDDNMSVVSESSVGSDLVMAPNDDHMVINRRRRRTRLDQLGPVEQGLQRLRPRNR